MLFSCSLLVSIILLLSSNLLSLISWREKTPCLLRSCSIKSCCLASCVPHHSLYLLLSAFPLWEPCTHALSPETDAITGRVFAAEHAVFGTSKGPVLAQQSKAKQRGAPTAAQCAACILHDRRQRTRAWLVWEEKQRLPPHIFIKSEGNRQGVQ